MASSPDTPLKVGPYPLQGEPAAQDTERLSNLVPEISTHTPPPESTNGSESAGANGVRRGRVHWHGSADGGPRSRLQVSQPNGPTVTARGGPLALARTNHPGPLQLSNRLSPGSEAAPGPATAPQPAIPTLSLTSAKGLDAEGLDNRAFLELQRELQRHETDSGSVSSWPSANRAGAVSVSQAPESPDETRAREEVQARMRERRGSETPQWGTSSVSGTSTPGEWATDSSYDPAEDPDLDHIDLVPGEVDGMPGKPRRSANREEEEDADEQPRGWARVRGLFGRPAENADTDREKGTLPHDQGGPTNTKSLPVTTSTGTRAGPRSRPTKFEREAARLVKNHKLAQRQGPIGVGVGPSINREHLRGDSEASTPDALETSANLDARPVHSGGVLGNLLKLYEQQQKERQRSMASGISSAADTSDNSTPAEGQGNLADLVAAELRRENAAAAARGSAPDAGGSPTGANRRMSWAPHALNSPSIGQALNGFTKDVVKTSGKVAKTIAADAGLEDYVEERPKAARSDAGVIGGLIATTGNLIGAVSPHHAQLGPNPKRPGYTLSRYLLPEMNAKTLKRTAQIVADAAPRPYRSSGVSSPGAQSPPRSGLPRGGDNDSSETQAVTPPSAGTGTPKKSRPASIIMMPHKRTQSSAEPTTPGTGGHGRKGSHGMHLVPGMHHARHAFGALARTWTGHSGINTPDQMDGHDYFGMDAEQLQKQEWQRKLRKRAKAKKKKEEIFITMHVAAILQRQEFIMKLSRALMMFGAPTHRIETQIQQTARVLEINCRCIYLPNLMLLAFGDDTTHTSETKFIKQAGGLDLTKLTDMHSIYWNVIHDKIGVGEASSQLDELMRRKPLIPRWPMVLIGGFCSAFICVGPMGFAGSFIDALVAFPLGCFLVFSQSVITTELYSNVFEIMFATLNSFVAAALHSTQYFCYSAVVSGSIVLILPGFIVLSGSLELQAKNLVAGSVRLVYAIIYSLFLGFGLSIGSSFWALVSSNRFAFNSRSVSQCQDAHTDAYWYRADVPLIWALLTVPGYSISLALRNQVKINRKEFPVMVLIACAGWACNHFSATSASLSGRQDITSALGSLCVGLLANIYGRMFDGRAFVVSVVGILYQLPSGLSNGGLLAFANTSSSSSSNFDAGWSVAQSLVEVALGLTVGLFAATTLAYTLGGRKVRGGGLFSF